MLRHLQAIIFEPTHPFLAEQDQTASFSYVYHQVMCWCSEISQFIIAWLLGHLVNGSFYSAVKHKTWDFLVRNYSAVSVSHNWTFLRCA